MAQGEHVVGLVSCPEEGEARAIARHLVESGLAACAHLVPGINAVYRWAGKIEENSQTLVIVKTRNSVWSKLEEEVQAMHSDEVPEIIALPIVGGLASYLAWMDGEVLAPETQA